MILISFITSRHRQSWTPLRQVLTSVPTLALIVLQYGNLWGFLFLVTGAPRFMSEVLGFSLAQAGLLASLPYICRWLGGIVFALLADWMRRRRAIGLMNLRRLFCVFCRYSISISFDCVDPK